MTIAVLALCSCGPSRETLEKQLPGTYRFKTERYGHGTDVLVLNADHSYDHLYTPLKSQTQQKQTGRWAVDDSQQLLLYGFVAWELTEWGPARSDAEFRNPPPTNVGIPLRSRGTRVTLLMNLDEDDVFERFDKK
jgi:hypothetical protein